MNKKTAIIIAVILLLVVAVGGFLLTSKKPTVMEKEVPAVSQQQTQPVTEKKSLRDLLALGQSQKCTYTVNTDAGNSSGTVYVSGKQMRSDVSLQIQGQDTLSHVIVNGDTSYIWVDGQPRGLKMTIDPSATPVPTITGSPDQVDWDSLIDYQCSPWTADPAMFEVPGDIMFSSLQEMMTVPTGADLGGYSQQDKCSACNSLSGDAKTQCLGALGCN